MSEEPRPSSDLQDRLRRIAQARLRSGLLPRQDPKRSFAGPGSGCTCALCDGEILETQVEFELDFGTVEPADSQQQRVVYMHLECHQVWEQERHRLGDCD
ncbi:MAG TPA: hypothetical protein VGN43_00345 [Steroidobacteraceae bacterium]|jgi:hypothetical protein|nr:hypothetical protein [Steroidobacteraceae bacterium]